MRARVGAALAALALFGAAYILPPAWGLLSIAIAIGLTAAALDPEDRESRNAIERRRARALRLPGAPL